jgi:penicillin-binding protein 1A
VAGDQYPVTPHALPEKSGGLLDRLLSSRRSLGGKTRQHMLDLLGATVIQGTGRAAGLAIPSYGKTGTSQDNRDALFIGFADDLVVGVWVGRDDNKPLGGVHGGGLPARIWRDFMGQAIAGAKRAQAPVEVENVQEPLGNDTMDVLPTIDLEGVEIDLGEDPAARVQTGVGGVDVNVNINRNGVTVQPTDPQAPPPPQP